jgi:hypothetical protein
MAILGSEILESYFPRFIVKIGCLVFDVVWIGHAIRPRKSM